MVTDDELFERYSAFPPPVRTIQNFRPMGPRSKQWIIQMRKVQLVFRLVQFLGAAGVLVIMIMLNNIKEVPGLVIRIAVRQVRFVFSPTRTY